MTATALLLLGAVANVLVAWGCALWSPIMWEDRVDSGYTASEWPCWSLDCYESATGSYTSGKPILGGMDVPGIKGHEPDSTWGGPPPDSLPDMPIRRVPPEFVEAPEDDGRPYSSRIVASYGWPLRTLEYSADHEYATWWKEFRAEPWTARRTELSDGLRSPFEPDRRERVVNEAILPLRPIWPGVFLNTIVCAALGSCALVMIHAVKLHWCAWSVRQRLAITTCWIVAGFVTTLAVAWASAALYHLDTIGRHERSDLASADLGAEYRQWILWVHRTTTAVCVESSWRTTGPTGGVRQPLIPPDELLPSWAGFARPVIDGDPSTSRYRIVDGRGWPAVALWSAFEAQVGKERTEFWLDGMKAAHFALELAPHESRLPNDVYPTTARFLPLGVHVPGLVFDVLFFAIAWCLLMHLAATPWTIRRMHRLRRGRCAKCGYDRQGALNEVCPECGMRQTHSSQRACADRSPH